MISKELTTWWIMSMIILMNATVIIIHLRHHHHHHHHQHHHHHHQKVAHHLWPSLTPASSERETRKLTGNKKQFKKMMIMTRTTIWNDDGFDIWSSKSLRDLIKLMSCSIFVWIWLCLEIGGKFKEIGFHFRKRHLWCISLWSWWHLWNQTWHRDSVDGHYDFKSCSFFSVLLRPCRTLLDFICHFHLLERFYVILINIF